MARRPSPSPAPPTPLLAAVPVSAAAPELSGAGSEETQLSGAEAQLALCEPDHLRRLEQPLKYGFADRSSARKGLEVAAGVAIADRLGSIRQTAGPPIGRHGYMAIVWLGSRWLQLEHTAASAVPFTQYRLLHDFGWEESGKNARQALKRTLLNLQEARWEGEVNDSLTGKKTHEDHFGIIDRVLWPVVQRRPPGAPGLHLPRQLVPRAAAPRGRRLHRLGRAARPAPHRPQALRAARERPLRGGRGRRGVAGLLARAPLLRERRLDLRPRARQRGRGGARLRGDRRPPGHRLPLHPRAGGRRRRPGPSSWWCGGRPAAPAGACRGCCARAAG